MFSVPVGSAYFMFVLWVAFWPALVYWRKPEYRHQMNRMGFCGGVGGVLISQLYRQDFWNPPSVLGIQLGPISLAIEDLIFGWAFMAIVTVLVPLFSAAPLERDLKWAATRLQKILVVSVAVLASAIGRALGLNWLDATTFGFASGVVIAYALNDNYDYDVTIVSGAATLLIYAFLVGTFIMMAGNHVALAEAICQFYVKHGAFETSVRLAFWAFAFGAYFGPFYPFISNKRYAYH